MLSTYEYKNKSLWGYNHAFCSENQEQKVLGQINYIGKKDVESVIYMSYRIIYIFIVDGID